MNELYNIRYTTQLNLGRGSELTDSLAVGDFVKLSSGEYRIGSQNPYAREEHQYFEDFTTASVDTDTFFAAFEEALQEKTNGALTLIGFKDWPPNLRTIAIRA